MTHNSRRAAFGTGIAIAFLGIVAVLASPATAHDSTTSQPTPSISGSTSSTPPPEVVIGDPTSAMSSVIVDTMTVPVPVPDPTTSSSDVTASLGSAYSTSAAPSSSASLGSPISTYAKTSATHRPAQASSSPPTPSTIVDKYCVGDGFVDPTTTCPATQTTAAKQGTRLADTGSSSRVLVLVGASLTAAGIGLLVLARRRHSAARL